MSKFIINNPEIIDRNKFIKPKTAQKMKDLHNKLSIRYSPENKGRAASALSNKKLNEFLSEFHIPGGKTLKTK